ncbi:hypothetical protein GLOTRDRAFT_25420, partial [Gloeophyllum trabeum ATCC 11539]
SNKTPSAEERDAISAVVSHAKAVFATAQAEVSRLEEQLTMARIRRDCASRFLKDHLALLSPIRKLPDELLSEVFFRCLPDDEYVLPRVKSSPFLVCAVCHKWRDIALATPRLW